MVERLLNCCMQLLVFTFLSATVLLSVSNDAHAIDDTKYCIYKGESFQGDSYCANHNNTWFGLGWFNKISSLEVEEGKEMVTFSNFGYWGDYEVFSGSNPTLGDWNNKIGSFYIRVKQPEQTKACFYARKNFRGRRFCTDDDQSWFGWFWDDRISSVSVPAGKKVTIFRRSFFRGGSVELTSSVANLGSVNFNNATSSLTIEDDSQATDADGDGIDDSLDLCADTPLGEMVNAQGCADSQLDTDNDGVTDDVDQCPGTIVGNQADEDGCSTDQLDTDNDGVSNDLDQCPATPVGEVANTEGCSLSQLDEDSDSVNDALDQCPATPAGAEVDANGCAQSQLDTDNDSITDDIDECPATPAGEEANIEGCSQTQLDDDGDGVNNALDQCIDTLDDETANDEGCAPSQLDTDEDGVNDALDICPLTPAGLPVNAAGCALLQLDSDGDGANDAIDQCPATPIGEAIDTNGCSLSQLDSDNDSVNDALDQCPNTAVDETANAEGCAPTQLDTDDDGANDAIDQCPATPADETANPEGCAPSQLDTDNDTVNDALDQCPSTPVDETANPEGCAASQLDSDNDGASDAVDQCPATPVDETANAEGCAPSQLDTDSDSVNDAVDQCPNTPDGEAANAEGCAPSQLDADNDGVNDAVDQCPNTPETDTANAQGCSPDQIDTDGDGTPDYLDAFPTDPAEIADLDGDGIGDNSDPDKDGDGVDNAADAFPNDATESNDLDGDGTGDNADTDRDGDGVANEVDAFPENPNETSDLDSDGEGDNSDLDRDGDGVANADDAFPDNSTETSDLDLDGIGDNADLDRDGDGINNDDDFFPDDPQASSVPVVAISAPQTLTTVGASPITISGTISDPNATLVVQGSAITHSNGSFQASVPLEEGTNTIIVRAIDQQNHEGIATITVSLDKTPPSITVESPANNTTVYQDTVSVSGLVNDIVRGTVSEQDAQVTVNGQNASVSNRYFLAENIPLQVGQNTITISAADGVGNSASATSTVTYQPQTGKIIELVNGQAQSQTIRAELPTSLTVALSENGAPIVNKTVIYRVIQGDGLLMPGTNAEAASAMVQTDSSGIAAVPFKLGSRAGNGNHQVRARAVGFEGEVVFYASADYGSGNNVGVIAGGNQRVGVRQPLATPFVVAVTDPGANLVPNADIEFKVVSGGGSFAGGQQSLIVPTDTDGRASAHFTAGAEEGLDAQRVEATLVGTTASAGFTVSAFMPGDPGDTKISGVVLDNQDQPLKGVTVRVDGLNRQAVTDGEGQFTISEAPVGPVHLLVEGSTADRAGEWPSLSYNIVTVPGVDNPMASPIFLVEIDTVNAVYVGAEDKTVTHPDLPGFELKVKAGSVTFPDGANEGNLSITKVNANKVPMPPPNGMQPQLIVTIQPHGAKFDPPAELTIPNTDGHAPGAEIEMYSYDHDLEEFVTIGLGTVAKDGATVKSNVGTGVIKAGWHCGSQAGGSACCLSCGPCEKLSTLGCSCEKDSFFGDPIGTSCMQPEDSCATSAGSPGCPTWEVSNKSLNLYVNDTPIWYDTPIGPSMKFNLTYNVRQRHGQQIERFGNKWQFGYGIYVKEILDQDGQVSSVKDIDLVKENGVRERFYGDESVEGSKRFTAFDGKASYIKQIPGGYRFVNQSGTSKEFTYRASVGSPTAEFGAIYMSKMSDIHGETMTFAYDTNGRLTGITDALSRVTTLEYNAQNRVFRISDPFGRSAIFGYDLAGNMVEITDMGGYRSTLTYEDQVVTSMTRPQFGTWYFKTESGGSASLDNGIYPAPDGDMMQNYRVTITDPKGDKSEHYYDVANDLTWMVSENDYKEYVSSELSNKNQPKKVYDIYRGDNNWTRNSGSVDQLNNGDSKTYNAQGQLRTLTHRNGRTDFYEYNEFGQPIEIVEAKGTDAARLYEFEYLDVGSLLVSKTTGPSVANGKRTQTIKEYDSKKYLSSVTKTGYTEGGQQIVRKTLYTYNDRGQVIEIDGERTDVDDITRFEYYDCPDSSDASCHQLRSVTNAVGQAITYNSYYHSGLASNVSDQNGLVSEIQYDNLNRVTEVLQYAGNGNPRVTKYTYKGAKRHILTTSLPNGLVVTNVYNDSEQLMAVEDSLGNRTEYIYDKSGNKRSTRVFGVEDVSDNQIQLEIATSFDLLNRITEVNRGGSVTQADYTAQGLVSSTTDPNNNPSKVNSYDQFDRLETIKDSLANNTNFRYNVNDQISEVIAPNNTTTNYRYNDFGEIIQEISPDRGEILYDYDAAGNLTLVTDARGIAVRHQFDKLNRPIETQYPDVSENIYYSYDSCTAGVGRLCSVTDPSGTSSFGYDAFGNTISESKLELGVEKATSYEYNLMNRVSKVFYPTGSIVTYQYDLLSRVTDVTVQQNEVSLGLLSNIEYRADGLLLKQTYGNGLVEQRAYDLQGRITSQEVGSVYSRSYSYDLNGNLLSVGPSQEIAGATYSYDAMDRLEAESGLEGEQSYVYDENGNRQSHTFEGLLFDTTEEYGYTLDTNLMVSRDNSSIIYDESGNITNDGARQLVYNQRGQISSLSGALGTTNYEYNVKNLRTQKNSANGQYLYHYDTQGRLIAESKDGLTSREIIWIDWQPIAQISGEQITFLTLDQNGSPRLGTDGTRSTVWAWDSDGFGSSDASLDVDGDGNEVNIINRFPGQYYDDESGLHYNWNRYYDPKTGRYLSSDPIGLKGGLNTFGYVNGRPLYFSDPTGLAAVFVGMEASSGFGGVGFIVVFCKDECDRLKIFKFKKMCIGVSIGAGFAIQGGPVFGLDDERCDPGNYSGYFFEGNIGLPNGISLGCDFGLVHNENYSVRMGESSGTNECGAGIGTPGIGVFLCWYTQI